MSFLPMSILFPICYLDHKTLRHPFLLKSRVSNLYVLFSRRNDSVISVSVPNGRYRKSITRFIVMFIFLLSIKVLSVKYIHK